MRKQTKLVAVLSAAALLAIGASMTSFAAGWQKNDDGTWNYYDNDDEMVSGEWKKDGNKWFYLDDDGIMLTDSWVDDEYYVGDDGAMIVNDWKKALADEDVDDPEDDGEAWYYFGSKGKKTGNGEATSKKIGGKTYYFADTGKMEDGWHQDGEKLYYLGDEDDGARKSGWLWLEAPDEDDVDAYGHDVDEDGECDEEGWYYFGSNGEAYHGNKVKKVNGKYYYFNNHGQMLYEWINGNSIDVGSNAQLDGNNIGTATPSDMLYLNVVEEGWRADGWYLIDGPKDLKDENDTSWYYFSKGKSKKADDFVSQVLPAWATNHDDGQLRAKIKIEGKYFCFNEYGQMQTGLQYAEGNTYFFDDNGYMKTGKVSNVEEDDDSFTYYFETKNGKQGRGVTGEKSGYLYWNGKRLEADDDYRVYKFDGDYYLVNKSGKIQTSKTKKYDVENGNGTSEVYFAFDGKKIDTVETAKLTTKKMDVTSLTDVLPEIQLYDGSWKPNK